MRTLSRVELAQVAGGEGTLLDAGGLNTSGAFTAIDTGHYTYGPEMPAASSGHVLESGRVESMNFFTPTGFAIQFSLEALEYVVDYWKKMFEEF